MRATSLELARAVLRLRYWQLLINEDLKKKLFLVPVHVAIGHEAIATAVSESMDPPDQLVLSHRNLAYNLARANGLAAIRDEFLQRGTGLCQGRLGSMNLVNPARGIVYSSSILGNNISVACGFALAKQVRGSSGVVIVLSGDGAMEEGPFYEGLVFAKSHGLALVIVVENNNQSMASTISERRCPISLADMCGSLTIPFATLSGNDVMDYASVVRTVGQRAAETSTPVCLEVHLAALNQHAGPTPGWPTDPKRISIDNGLIVEATTNDPVFVLQRQLGSELFDGLSREVTATNAEPSHA